MKVMQREIMKVLPGKMPEALALIAEHRAIAGRLGSPPWRGYRCIENMHTLVFETDWRSLAAMDAFFEKGSADPEMQGIVARWEKVLESDILEFYALLS